LCVGANSLQREFKKTALRPEDCPKLNRGTKKVFPVCLHPDFGGWFALRGVIIFAELTSDTLLPREPPEILKTEDEIQNLLELYNDHWRDWSFRDVINVKERYSADQVSIL
jgi:methylmalonic aciduria homocystinuria type C protein